MTAFDFAPWFGALALAAGAWIAHRALRHLERRGWVYYLGRDR
jgi:hypothetical protein